MRWAITSVITSRRRRRGNSGIAGSIKTGLFRFARNDILWFLMLMVCLVTSAPALAYTPLIYSKSVIRIVPVDDTKADSKKEDEKKKGDGKKAEDSKVSDLLPSLYRVGKEFTVEVRPMSFLEQHDFIAHQPFTDKEGMMMVIDPPEKEQLRSSNLLGKIDVLFVLEDGTIDKIAPNLALTELVEPINTEKPVKAFVFLKAGMAQASDIRPGDHVAGTLFKTHPVILQ